MEAEETGEGKRASEEITEPNEYVHREDETRRMKRLSFI